MVSVKEGVKHKLPQGQGCKTPQSDNPPGPLIDKFVCNIGSCQFKPRLPSKLQMYAHYGMEHYRWVEAQEKQK